MENVIRFTKTAIDALTPPAEGRAVYRDPGAPTGLRLRVTANGAKSWYWFRKVNGKTVCAKIGDVADVTPDAARRRAQAFNGDAAGGVNPSAEKRAARESATLGDLWADFLENHVKVQSKPHTIRNYTGDWRRYLEPLAGRKLSEVTGTTVEQLKSKIGREHGKTTANRVLALLSAMFRKRGRFLGLPAGFTPTTGIERFTERSRDRILTDDEMPRFVAALEAEQDGNVRDYLKLSLFCGARRSNLMAMRWEDISEKGRTWTVPGEQSKNGAALVIPLVPEAWAIIEARAKLVPEGCPYVFAGNRIGPDQVEQVRKLRAGGMSTRDVAKAVGISQTQVCRALRADYKGQWAPMTECRKGFDRVKAAAKIGETLTLHDLRRSFVSWQFKAGASVPQVQAAAGHKSSATTLKSYAVALQAGVRASVAGGVAAMLATPAEPKKTNDKAAGAA